MNRAVLSYICGLALVVICSALYQPKSKAPTHGAPVAMSCEWMPIDVPADYTPPIGKQVRSAAAWACKPSQ